MREVELKVTLDAEQEKALRRSAIVREYTLGRPKTQTLHSVYYDTPDGALRRDQIALRLRKIGRQWVQTVKQAPEAMQNGLSTPEEFETTLRSPQLELAKIENDDLREMLIGYSQTGLRPTVETLFRRTSRQLVLPSGAEIELAIDAGEVRAGELVAPILEAELELKSGIAADLYALGAEIFDRPPIRFSTMSKSARAAALLDPDTPLSIRKSRKLSLSAEMTAEQAATYILREGLSHYLPNLAETIESEALHGPHQSRVALRRMRSALSTFKQILGAQKLQPWAETAKHIATQLGAVRDIDVVLSALLVPLQTEDPEAHAALVAHVEALRVNTQKTVRAALLTPGVTKFGFGLAGFLEGRGWIEPSDHNQTRRLAQPLGPLARKVLRKRWKGVATYGERMGALSIEERHEMRKALKKLRYMLDAFRALYDPADLATFMRAIKDLQTAFGALNDQAMAEEMLLGPEAPGAGDPIAQRGVGRLLGQIDVEAERLWPMAQRNYVALAKLPKPWR